MSKVILKTILIATFLGSAASLSPAIVNSSHAQSYDGVWKIGRKGRGCTPNGLIKVQINSNSFSGSYIGGSGKHVISGNINDNGTFKFAAKSPRDTVRFRGKIKNEKGKGSWKVAGRSCGGSLKIFK